MSEKITEQLNKLHRATKEAILNTPISIGVAMDPNMDKVLHNWRVVKLKEYDVPNVNTIHYILEKLVSCDVQLSPVQPKGSTNMVSVIGTLLSAYRSLIFSGKDIPDKPFSKTIMNNIATVEDTVELVMARDDVDFDELRVTLRRVTKDEFNLLGEFIHDMLIRNTWVKHKTSGLSKNENIKPIKF